MAGSPQLASALDPEVAARQAKLRYVDDQTPGFSRRRHGRGFSYHDAHGHLLPASIRDWIKSLAIPPAWTDVWICAWRDGHILATGRDERGRKQYIYHPRWTEMRKQTNFHRLLAFGRALPLLRRRIDADLRRTGLPRERVLALIVHLLQSTLIRIGNPEYAHENHSFGLTTLREEHLQLHGRTIHFEFRGKSGKWHRVDLYDARAARAIRRCQELPGQELFQYVDEEGERHCVESADVNLYLSEASNEPFTAKVFRTWGGSVTALEQLVALGPSSTRTETERGLREAVKLTATRLANTPAVCRNHYIHPVIIERYREGTLQELRVDAVPEGLHRTEALLLQLLEETGPCR